MKRHIMYLIFLIGFIVSACGATVGDSTGGNPLTTPSSSYSPVSPHYPHMRTMTTDFGVHWQPDADRRKANWDWAARYFDYVLIDQFASNNVQEYKSRNPNIKIVTYALNWTVGKTNCSSPPNNGPGLGLFTGFCRDMINWLNTHGYDPEDAFLHDNSKCPAPQQKSESCRISFVIWGSERWILNPGDPRLRAYQKDRFQRMGTFNEKGYYTDAIFLDEHASGDMYGWENDRLKAYNIREYFENGQTNWQRFEADMVSLLAEEREAAKMPLHINIGEEMKEFNFNMALSAGAVHTENLNKPTRPLDLDGVWDWYDRLINNNVFVEVLGPKARDIPSSYDKPGLYSSPYARFLMTMFTSYYMVAPEQNKLDKVVFHWGIGGDWDEFPIPLEKRWLKAFNVNIGTPIGARYKYTEGKDPNDKPYRIWARNFEKALVLIRPVGTWGYNTYDDSTAVEVTLPQDDSYYLLNDDGTRSGPLKSIKLRNSEGAILLKGSKLQ